MVFSNVVNMVNSDKSIIESGEKFFTIGIPCQGGTHEISRFFTFFFGWLGFNCCNWFGGCAHQVPNFNGVFSSDSDPLHFWIESNLIDGGTSIKFSRVVGKIKDIPNVEFFIFTSGSNIFSVWWNRNRVDVSFVSFEGISNLEIGWPDF